MKKIFTAIIFLIISIGIVAQTDDIYAPTQISPDSAELYQTPNQIINWSAVVSSGVVSYEMYLDTDPTFPNPVIINTDYTAFQNADLLFGQQYFWKVRAMEGGNISEWSPTWPFTVFDQVTLSSPKNDPFGDEKVRNVFETLKWKSRTNGSSGEIISGVWFHYEVDTIGDFTDPMISDTCSILSADLEYLMFNTNYYWRVRAEHDLDETNWSETWQFLTFYINELKKPEDGSTGEMLDVNLGLKDTRLPLQYEFVLDTDINFSNPIIIIADNKIVDASGLTFDTKYYWKARCFHEYDHGGWSEVWDFTTIDKTELITPEDGAIEVSVTPKFLWEKIDGITSYELQYDTNQNFLTPEIQSILVGTNSFTVLSEFDFNQEIFWKVRAWVDADSSYWTNVWSFTTEIREGIETIDGYLAGINVFPNPSSGKIFLTTECNENSTVQLFVMDLLGQVVIEKEISFVSGFNSKEILLDNISNGIYIIKIQKDESSISKKIIIDK
jgi:hypothetical protein